MTEAQVKKNIFLFYLSEAIFGTYFQQAIWIVYQSKFLNFEQISFFAALAVFVEFLMQMPTGAFADLVGRKLSLALSHLLTAAPMFLIAIWPRPEIMWIYSIIWGIGRAFSSGPDTAIVYDSLKSVGQENNFAKINSKGTMSFQFTAAISILIGGYLYLVFPSLTYYVSGAFSLTGIFVSMMFIDNFKQKSKFRLSEFVKTNWLGVKEIFKNSFLTKFSLMYILLLGTASPNQKFFIQPYMLEIGMNDIERGWMAMIVKIGITTLGVWLVGSKKILEKPVFIFVIPIIMLLTLIPAPFVRFPLTYLIIFGVAFTSGNSSMFIMPELNKHIDSSIRATAISAEKMFGVLIYSLVTYISGPIIAKSGVGRFFLYEGIFTVLIILPLAFSIYRHKQVAIVR